MRDEILRNETRDVRAMIHTKAGFKGLDHPWTYFKWMYLVGLKACPPSGGTAWSQIQLDSSSQRTLRASSGRASVATAGGQATVRVANPVVYGRVS